MSLFDFDHSILYQMSTDRDSSFDIENERRLLEQRLNAMNNSELQAFDLQLTLLRSAHDSYKRESVLKPCPQFFNELTREEIVRNELFFVFKWKFEFESNFSDTSLSSTARSCFSVSIR